MALISIVIPVKNGKRLLQQCVESVLSQTFEDYEVLILTDATTNNDGTLDYLKSLKTKKLQVFESTEQLSIEQNWGRIMDIPKAKFFTILGYDDLLYPDYLETVVGLIDAYPDATLYQTHFDFIDQNTNVIRPSPQIRLKVDGVFFLERLLRSEYPVIATGFVIRSEDYKQVGGIPVHYPNLLYADFELWLRLTFLHYQVISPQKCFAFRIHQSTTKVSSNKKTLAGFSCFVSFLKSLQTDSRFANVIKSEGEVFLQAHCNSLVYRVVRNPNREDEMSVKNVISAFEQFSVGLGLKRVNLKNVNSIFIASLIDRSKFSREVYRFFKTVVYKATYEICRAKITSRHNSLKLP